MSRPPGRVALARMWRGGGHSLAKPWEDAMLTAADVMTTDVVTVVPETPVRDIARLLHTKRISGVPVVSPDNRVIGIVSEGDLIGVASENSIHLTRSHRRIRTRSSAAFALGRPRPVHLALSSLSPHSGCNEHRQARDCRTLASQGFYRLLAMEIPLARGPAADRPRGARADPKNEF